MSPQILYPGGSTWPNLYQCILLCCDSRDLTASGKIPLSAELCKRHIRSTAANLQTPSESLGMTSSLGPEMSLTRLAETAATGDAVMHRVATRAPDPGDALGRKPLSRCGNVL